MPMKKTSVARPSAERGTIRDQNLPRRRELSVLLAASSSGIAGRRYPDRR